MPRTRPPPLTAAAAAAASAARASMPYTARAARRPARRSSASPWWTTASSTRACSTRWGRPSTTHTRTHRAPRAVRSIPIAARSPRRAPAPCARARATLERRGLLLLLHRLTARARARSPAARCTGGAGQPAPEGGRQGATRPSRRLPLRERGGRPSHTHRAHRSPCTIRARCSRHRHRCAVCVLQAADLLWRALPPASVVNPCEELAPVCARCAELGEVQQAAARLSSAHLAPEPLPKLLSAGKSKRCDAANVSLGQDPDEAGGSRSDAAAGGGGGVRAGKGGAAAVRGSDRAPARASAAGVAAAREKKGKVGGSSSAASRAGGDRRRKGDAAGRKKAGSGKSNSSTSAKARPAKKPSGSAGGGAAAANASMRRAEGTAGAKGRHRRRWVKTKDAPQ